jgi:hypothetical protein
MAADAQSRPCAHLPSFERAIREHVDYCAPKFGATFAAEDIEIIKTRLLSYIVGSNYFRGKTTNDEAAALSFSTADWGSFTRVLTALLATIVAWFRERLDAVHVPLLEIDSKSLRASPFYLFIVDLLQAHGCYRGPQQ